MTNDRERALLVVMPLEDLHSALTLPDADNGVVLPVGGPGDLDLVPAGTPVLVMASDPSGDEVPAATWRATLVGRVPHEPGAPYPERLPSTWLERHTAKVPDDGVHRGDVAIDDSPHPDDDDALDDDLDAEEPVGPQSFFEVRDLRELPKQEWLFVNELVGKQARGGRTFFARVPIMVRVPD